MILARRSVLAGLALAAATGARAQAARAYDTIVIGAGLSGLRTAMMLAEEGQRVLILEASRRIGGRIFTLDALPGHPEAGANSLLSGYGRALDLCATLGLPLIDVSPRAKLARTDLVIGGERITMADWKTSPRNPLPEAWRALPPAAVPLTIAGKTATLEGEDWCDPANAPLDIGMDKALQRAGLSPAAIDLAYNTNPGYGRDASEVSLLNLLFVSSFFATQTASGGKDHVVTGGNQRLPEAIARTMKAELRLDTPVAAVTQDSAGVEVRTAGGERLRAARVVCAVPLGPLGRIAFDPPLPPLHAEAARSVPYMAIRQAHIVADTPFWTADAPPASLWTDQPVGTLAANRGGATDAEITSFTAWSRGALAETLDAMPGEDASRQILDGIARAWPASRGRLRVAATHSWKTGPWQGGAWAVWKPGQASRLPRSVGAVHGRVHFCGEHSALSARGMEGALESAERVAVEILLA
ncbi:flavin monoamine oxidase family protein [Polymorphobacter sp.]|uniref:flavin monoamine oxidase family protein n=1 Tax=Polymorphobacter sp. TaxID=1909290 RepID=UPI003F722583